MGSSSTATDAFRPSRAVLRVEAASLRVPQPATTAEVVSLAMGEPSFDTPRHIVEAGHEALDKGLTHYGHPQGDPELRSAVAERLSATSRCSFGSDGILITHGGTAGLAAAILATVDPGDKVVIPDPTYSLYADLVHLAGGITVRVPLQDDLHWDLDGLRDALTDAKVFVFCNPSNPTGIVHTEAELVALTERVSHTGTLVIADEAYSELTYTSSPFVSALDIEGLAEGSLYCQTFSKAYAMTGWRVGYLAGSPDAIRAAARVHSTTAGPLNLVTQHAALSALDGPSSVLDEMRETYRRRREVMLQGLEAIEAVQLSTPDGAFYAFPRYDHEVTSVEMVAYLRQRGVAVRPGSEFGPAGEGHLRLSFAAGEDSIELGVHRMKAALEDLREAG